MKLLVVGATDGNIDLFNQYAEESGCDAILATGSIGIYYRNDKNLRRSKHNAGNFHEYISGKKKFIKPIVAVPGVFENFKLVKYLIDNKLKIFNFKLLNQGEKYVLDINGESIGVIGLGRGYSPTSYQMDKKLTGNRRKHFTHKDVAKIGKEANIILMHELPSPYVGKNVEFSDDLLKIFNETLAFYSFAGHYKKWFHVTFPKMFRCIEFISLPTLTTTSYGVLDTKTWDFTSNDIIRKQYNG